MPVPLRKTNRNRTVATVALGLLAAGSLFAFQFGDRYELNGTPYAQVQVLAADLTKAKALAQQGNIDLFAEAPVPGKPVVLHGEVTDANCYLANHAHGYDHAFCAKLCATNGSPLLFVGDKDGHVYVVLSAKNAVRLPDAVLDRIGVPGIRVKGQVVEAGGVHALAIEDLAQ